MCLSQWNLLNADDLREESRKMLHVTNISASVQTTATACLSLSVSVSVCLSACLPGWIAAIIVTQLTTPYIRIAPAAGDKQLTGQTHTATHRHTQTHTARQRLHALACFWPRPSLVERSSGEVLYRELVHNPSVQFVLRHLRSVRYNTIYLNAVILI